MHQEQQHSEMAKTVVDLETSSESDATQERQPSEIAKMVVNLETSSELDATKDNRKRDCEKMIPKDKTKKFKNANAEEMRISINSIRGEASGSVGKDAASACMLQNRDKSQIILDSSAFAVQTLSSMFNQLKESDANQSPTDMILRNIGNMLKKINNNNNALNSIKTVRKHYVDVSQIIEVMFSAIKQVLELPRNPSQDPRWFIKLLFKSDLADGSSLDLPQELRKEHLPMCNKSLSVPVILLVDEHEQEHEMDYSFTAHKFRGNWKDLYLKHRLSCGDALVFYEIGKCKFKVHIVRRRIDGTPGNSKLGILDNTHEAGTSRPSCDHTPTPHQLVQCNTSNSSAVPTCIQDSEAVLDFKNVKCFEDFKISVNGEILNSKLPEPTRMKYYELCSGQKQFLHKNIKGLNSDLVVGVILQTITTVDAMKVADISTSLHELENMRRNLKSFQDLGFEVEFLLVRLDKLIKLSRERLFVSESKRVKLAEVEEQERALDEEVSKLDEILQNVKSCKSFVGHLGDEVEILEKESKQLDLAFKEVIDSAW